MAIEQQYTVAEVSKLIKVTQRTIRRWIADGRLSPVNSVPGRFGHDEYRIPESTVMKVLRRESDDNAAGEGNGDG